MIEQITFRSLCTQLEEAHFFRISYQNFKGLTVKNWSNDAKAFFEKNDDYHLLIAARDQEIFFRDYCFFKSIIKNKNLFFRTKDIYKKSEYQKIFALAGHKPNKEHLQSLFKIANGY